MSGISKLELSSLEASHYLRRYKHPVERPKIYASLFGGTECDNHERKLYARHLDD